MYRISQFTYSILRGFQTGMMGTVVLNLSTGMVSPGTLGFAIAALIVGVALIFVRPA